MSLSPHSKWVRSFRVELCSKMKETPTLVYKVTSNLYPHGFPEASTEIVVYKYYSDFIRLHATLKSLHLSLFPSKGPEFPVLSCTGGCSIQWHSEPDLSMEERRAQSLSLLEYASTIPQLYNSDIFNSFTMTNSASSAELDANIRNESEKTHEACPVNEPESLETEELPAVGSPSLEETLLLAEFSEEKLELNESISHYKKAIKKLLDRAKILKDENPLASKGLSRRASEYLKKVESLIKKPNRNKQDKMESKEGVSDTKVPYSDLFGDEKDLNRYKVTGVLAERNIIAMDTRRRNMKVVLKTLQKAPMVFKAGRTSLLPINIRFMVKLLCYYETDDFIYLVLENVDHGRIYDLVSYIFSTPYSIFESNHPKPTIVSEDFLSLSSECQVSDEDDITRVELREDGLFCLDRDCIEDISFESKEKKVESEVSFEVGEEALGANFMNESETIRSSSTKKASHTNERSSKESSHFLFDFFPHTANKESLLPLALLRKWTFQMCQVLFGLHARNIIVKDLNPDNLLLDESCDLKLTYQCQWVNVDKPLSSEALERGYVAPELSYVEPLTPTCDWWSVGVILFELSSGVYYSDMYPSGILSHTPIQYPNQISHLIDEDLKDFVEQLVQPIPHLRLGAGSEGPATIKSHPFLKMYDLKCE